jgi:hypothetical protein
MMRPIVLGFIGGIWDGKCLRTDSSDQEEAWLAAGYYEMSHHGEIGAECWGLSVETAAYARNHWPTSEEAGLGDLHHRYVVSERRETAEEVVITFMHAPQWTLTR